MTDEQLLADSIGSFIIAYHKRQTMAWLIDKSDGGRLQAGQVFQKAWNESKSSTAMMELRAIAGIKESFRDLVCFVEPMTHTEAISAEHMRAHYPKPPSIKRIMNLTETPVDKDDDPG